MLDQQYINYRERTPGCGAAERGLAAQKSSPTNAAIVAAICDCVDSTFSRTPSGGVSGPRMADQMNSAVGTFLP